MKKYKAIFFDWDGTATSARHIVKEQLVEVMQQLLAQDVKLIIISGTTYENIANGQLHQKIASSGHKNLYMGLARGAYNYGFNETAFLLEDGTPKVADKLRLDDACYAIHHYLLERHGLNTDITFSRPNYCKLDLMPLHNRKDQLFMNSSEIEMINQHLANHEMEGGMHQLLKLAKHICTEHGIDIQATTDAKYVEIGFTTKSDNVNFFMKHLGLTAEDCVFVGDEFSSVEQGILGSDAYMITPLSKQGTFIDVNNTPHLLPESVVSMKGAELTFYDFLVEQSKR